MPVRSEQQRKWMYVNKPEMAERWEKETPKGKKLPKHVKGSQYAAMKKKVTKE